MLTIAVLGTLDTKGTEHAFLADLIRARGHRALMIDIGTGGPPQVTPDITRDEVAAAGQIDLAAIMQRADRGECVTAMSLAAPLLLEQLRLEGRIDGVISLGGGGGTAIATAGMRGLPIGFPKLMVSTLACGQVNAYLGTKDIVMMPAIVDIAGLNRISKTIFSRAAGAISGMVEAVPPLQESRPLIVASMFGNTTKCVGAAQAILEAAGYEVVVFAATGTGGRIMESLIESGLACGVLDITTTELADELVGGNLTAGPDRLNAAARCKVPAIVTPGCLDMVNFGARDTVPEKYRERLFYQHNPQVTLMRTTPEECHILGQQLAEKVNRSTAPVTILWPAKAVSVISAAGQPFHDPSADAALFQGLTSLLRPDIELIRLDCEINDTVFSQACADALLKNIQTHASQAHSMTL